MSDTNIEVYVDDNKDGMITVPVRQKFDFLDKVPIFIGKYEKAFHSAYKNNIILAYHW